MELDNEGEQAQNTDEEKGNPWKFGKSTDGLNWKELGQELKNAFKFNPENRSWGVIVKTFLVIFATSSAPSFFDMGSDAFSVYNFIHGTTYTKYVPNIVATLLANTSFPLPPGPRVTRMSWYFRANVALAMCLRQ